MAMTNRGALPTECNQSNAFFGAMLKRIPLLRGGGPLRRTCCASERRTPPTA